MSGPGGPPVAQRREGCQGAPWPLGPLARFGAGEVGVGETTAELSRVPRAGGQAGQPRSLRSLARSLRKLLWNNAYGEVARPRLPALVHRHNGARLAGRRRWAAQRSASGLPGASGGISSIKRAGEREIMGAVVIAVVEGRSSACRSAAQVTAPESWGTLSVGARGSSTPSSPSPSLRPWRVVIKISTTAGS